MMGWLACGTGKSSSSSVSGGGGLAGAVSCGSGGRGGISVSTKNKRTNLYNYLQLIDKNITFIMKTFNNIS